MDKPKKSRKERNNSRPSDDEKVTKDKKDPKHEKDKSKKKDKDDKGSKSKNKEKKGKSKDKDKKSKDKNKAGDEDQNNQQTNKVEKKLTEDIGFDDRKGRSGTKLDKDNKQQFLNNKVHPGKRNKEKMDSVVMNLETARSAQSNEGEEQNLLDDDA